MDLTQKFELATSTHSVRISDLEINKKYPIIGTQHLVTKYGPMVLLSLQESSSDPVKVL
jgi:hypothetical protein